MSLYSLLYCYCLAPYDFSSRCKFSNLTTRQLMVEFYLLTFQRLPLRKKDHKSYLGKNRTHDFRTSKCAGYLLDYSGDERLGFVKIKLDLPLVVTAVRVVLSLSYDCSLHTAAVPAMQHHSSIKPSPPHSAPDISTRKCLVNLKFVKSELVVYTCSYKV